MLSGVNFRATSLVGLLILMVLAPLAVAEPAENGLELRVQIDEPENGLYLSDESDLEVTIRIKNHADNARELTYNPACPFDLILTNDGWGLDIDDERICPTQSRAMIIQPGQERILSTWTWDWGDAPSGEIVLEFTQPDSNLQVTDSVILHRTVEMPANLQLEALLSETIGEQVGHTTAMPAMIYLSLTNSGTETIDLPFDENCRIQTDVITTVPCGIGPIESGEKMELGWVIWDFSGSSDGDYTIPFTLTGVNGAEASVSTMYTQTPAYPISDVAAVASIELGDELIWRYTLENSADKPAKLLFKDACIVEMHVISPSGEIMYDTRVDGFCPSSGVEHMISPQTTYTLSSESWNFMDFDGCEIDDGLHLLVLSQPDHGLVATQPFMHTNSGENPTCGTVEQNTEDIRFRVGGLTVLDADGSTERIAFDLTIQNIGNDGFELYWPTDCSLEFSLALVGKSAERVWTEDCDGVAGHQMTMPSQSGYTWPTTVVPFIDNGVELPHGTWQLSIRTTSLPAFTTQIAHTYDGSHFSPVVDQNIDDEPIEEIPEEQEKEMNEEVILSGDWNYVTTPKQGCWLLTDSIGTEHSFIAHMQDGGWSPNPGLTGSYRVEVGDAAGDCSTWSGIVILQTLDETDTMPEIVAPIVPTSPSPSAVDQIIEYAPASIAVVATTSLSIMSLLYLGNTEWIRIPALQVGIGIIGMVRRNGEHDGEYQRGRIMGYLTANPGVHFRALLGALEMSNGQLTHHLKHLETEERVWRRKDGRLVRFYPASIQSTLDEQELPVPLLTPDPNSLQGKILRLLDATENDIVNLSQKELAVRLEASQQLISHHLRTLEKFGLVEREKVGMRYRYQLTREAIFLVNSNDYDVTPE
ncbi:MAG: ArsR family transcriptional regulator [Candidatus Thalassarchaeaceae archaeon]|nr:ArsR family transcriptional regulator [Candidatus Thalassarchaeaceae archaeon]